MMQGVAAFLTAGILLTILSLVFLLNLAVGLFWPVLLIMGGLAFLTTWAFLRRPHLLQFWVFSSSYVSLL